MKAFNYLLLVELLRSYLYLSYWLLSNISIYKYLLFRMIEIPFILIRSEG